MGKDDWFDNLAKDSAQRLTRRQVFTRLLGGTAVAALSLLGVARDKPEKDCGKLCQECCHNAFPDHGPEYGKCVSECQHGEGLCGPIVCPKD